MPIKHEYEDITENCCDCDVTGNDLQPEDIFLENGNYTISREGYDLIPERMRQPDLLWLVVGSLREPGRFNYQPRTDLLKRVGKGIYALAVTDKKTWLVDHALAVTDKTWWVDHIEARRFYDLDECKDFLTKHRASYGLPIRYIVFVDGIPVLRATSEVEVTCDTPG